MNQEESEAKRFTLKDAQGSEVLRFDDVIVVGRMANAVVDGQETEVQLVISEGLVSRVHARLTAGEMGIAVEDLGSTNGTFINDQRVREKTIAADGDCIRFDTVEFTLIDSNPPAAARATALSGAADQGTVLRQPEPAPAEPEDDEGVKGGTIIAPFNRNLPKAWMQQGRPGTVLVSDADRENAGFEPDAEKLEGEVEQPTLLVLTSNESGQPYQLESAGEVNFWNIGKDAVGNDLSIVIDDPSVSDFHAKLIRRGDRWKIIDQMSTNHTYVNGKDFNAAFLSSRDHIRLGQVECLFLLPKRVGQRPVARPGKRGGGLSGVAKIAIAGFVLLLAVAVAMFLR